MTTANLVKLNRPIFSSMPFSNICMSTLSFEIENLLLYNFYVDNNGRYGGGLYTYMHNSLTSHSSFFSSNCVFLKALADFST